MSLKPLEHDRKYGELDQVIRAHLGRTAGDEEALTAYLRHSWRTRPWAIAVAEHQLREYAQNPPGRLRLRLGEFYPVPDVGLPDNEIQDWLLRLADRLKESVETGAAPAPATPRTRWEWHARFPELGQLLGGWFSQDMPDEFEDHGAALRDYLDGTDPGLIAQLAGELHDLLSLPLDESDYAVALAELGMEVDPPASQGPGAWLAELADLLR
ncbi:contact-dependent growth inhibition system immunity protein [Streptomyces sp. NBC_00335]|uniref:contact-dependent growth inhibition system immunity protein n=1 Tax=unclassified Streptomyces TaxID=2593676 RepID=UPI00225538BA|nr:MULTISPECIES: contact-dependent growth inhibition system immunity protein [unclassified Streptomyces]MCX5403834.1 contact-dependent growth inhibition system immunity protein [Streptomyces sp. NBC_00086]